MSKGSKRRPGTITDEQWARTFGSVAADSADRLASARQRSAENRARRGSDWTPPDGGRRFNALVECPRGHEYDCEKDDVCPKCLDEA